MFKIYFFFTPIKCNIIDINADDITIQKLCFNEGSSTTCKLVKNHIAFI